jgi:hypothetical protein
MPARTQLFQLLPWVGGLNTSVDESMIPPNQLTVADNLIFDTRGSRKKREGINHDWDDASNSTASIIKLHDFWFGTTTRTQRLVGVASSGAFYSYASGVRTTLTDAGTAYVGTLAHASTLTFFNKLIIAVDGANNVLKEWDGSGNVTNVAGTPPQASILCAHQGRIWCNDKTNPDRLHYSPVGDRTQWNGAGDSGAFDIGAGDGDPEGITGIVSFKGDLFVFKKTKVYRIIGPAPEVMQIILVSNGIGCVSHNSITPIDQDDVFWVSERGVHSLATTANYGDFEASYISGDIQLTFNEFSKGRLKYVHAGYASNLNAVAFTFTSDSATTNDSLYLYNIPLKAWFTWPNLSCQSLVVANDSDKKRFYLGTSVTRVSKTLNGTNYDITTAGVQTAIRLRIVTGQIFPDQSIYSMKAFKRFLLFYRPRGTHSLTASVRVDNFGLNAENSMVFSEIASSDLLGSTFILGQSQLGYDVVLGAYTRMIDGVGRGIRLEITQTDTDSEVEIQGFGIEFEPAGVSPETYLR